MRRRLTVLAAILLLMPLIHCSLDYEGSALAEGLSEQVPDTILHNFTHTVVRDGKKIFRIHADYSETYADEDRVVLKNISFKEYDPDGKVVSEGRADEAVFYPQAENAEIWGGIRVYSLRENAVITAPSLYWESESRILESSRDGLVVIEKDSGDEVMGRGFEVDMRRNILRFSGSSQGTIVLEDDETKGDSDADVSQ